ncbi:MAG: penicillin acylase family protein [Nevskia sp.]|nr:penicillin acylase family protein [Nevskia sp.]
MRQTARFNSRSAFACVRHGGRLSFLLGAGLALAACGSSSPVSGTAGSGSNGGGETPGSPPSGNLGPGDGSSIYLNILPPGSNGDSAGGVGLPVAGTPASYPANYNDQSTMYGDLSYAKQGLTATPCTPPTDLSQHVASSNLGCNYFKHDGLTPDTVVSSETLTTPYGGTVTIQHDGWGVPFITASNRRDAMYGVGYAQAEDRLWIMDVLRHFGRGELSQFLGPAPMFYQYDAALAVTAGYSEDEITQMVDQLSAKFGDLGILVLQDVDANVAGVNAYIKTLTGANVAKVPTEYALLKNGGYPPPAFTRNDVVASAILLQSIFAVGGGSEVTNEAFLQQLDPTVTGGNLNLPVAACQLWRDLRHADDPDATRTVSATFQQSPATLNESCPQTLPAGAAIWDVGSYQVFDAYNANGTNENLPAPGVTATARADGAKTFLAQLLFGKPQEDSPIGKKIKAARATLLAGLQRKNQAASTQKAKLRQSTGNQEKRRPVQVALGPYAQLHNAVGAFGVPPSMSNWMAVTAANTVDGHPIGVMGPQIGYFQPHIIWEYAVHSTGGTPTDLDGRGMAVAGIPYVLIGRGTDYAWSATSNDSDIVDTRVSKMCNLDGSAPSLKLVNGFPSADGYLYDMNDGKGAQCRRFYKRTDSWTASPTLASIASGGSILPASVHRYVLRTHYGPVFATATVGGAPVVISLQRSNFFGELDGAAMFALASTPTVHGASSFQHLFNGYTGTFNWLYVDKQDIGYIATGLLPVRDQGQSPELPSWGDGRFEWAGDRSFLKQNPDYFNNFGGDVPFPSRTVPVAQNGGPLSGGYYEWQNYLTYAQHPQVVNPSQGYILSWNNSPAAGWWAADNRPNWGPIHRIDTEPKRFDNFLATGKKFDFANVEEIMADAGYVDIRGQELLPLLLQIMQQGSGTLTADETQAATLMQNWLDGLASDGKTLNGSSNAWINGNKGLGAWRRSRMPGDAGKTTYDNQPAVVLMDAWYLHLMATVTSQLNALDPDTDQPPLSGACLSNILLCRQDAPRAQGSAWEFGWYQPMYRMLQTVLNVPGHHEYQALKCAGTGVLADCRNAVLSALDSAIAELGGISNMAKWNGTQLPNMQGLSKATVESYDSITPSDFSALPAQPIPWQNRPTYQQVIEITSGR